MRILVVEDSEADQFLFKLFAEESFPDVDVLQAYDGQQAQDMLVDGRDAPAALFLDINMPRMNGYDFLEKNHNLMDKKNISVYMLSSSNQNIDKEKAMAYGCVKRFIEKPFKAEELQEALSSLH